MIARQLRILDVVRIYIPHACGFALWTALVVCAHTLSHHPERWGIEQGILYHGADLLMWGDTGIPFGAIAALGGALAIFLGFRNNSAYDRWWEARKIWGALVNDSRSWARQVLAWVENGDSTGKPSPEQRELVHRHLAFVHALVHHLRQQPEALRESLGVFLDESEVIKHVDSPNAVTSLLIEQGCQIARLEDSDAISHFRHLSMDQLLSRLSDIQGKCERIKNTPVPRQYDALPRWFTYFYGAMLPFGLVATIGWGAVPVGVSITTILLALELSGRSIEDPFENTAMDIPMSALANTIERDLRHALGESLPSKTVPNDRGILM